MFCFGVNARQLEKTWNVSFRVMFGLPRESHQYFVEAMSERPHLKTILIKRYLNFIDQIRKSKKSALKNLLRLIENDTRSITGSNLREILILTKKKQIFELCLEDAELIKYKDVPESENWRIQCLTDLINVRCGISELDGFTEKDINHMIRFVSCD